VTISGAQVAAASIATCIRTHTTAINSYLIEVQQTSEVAAADTTKNGVAHFNSAQFTVTGGGFVSIVGGRAITGVTVDEDTAPGTDPVLPDPATGLIVVTGGQVANGTTVNAIQTNSLAANTYTIQIQRSEAVVPGSAALGLNGISHFDATSFAVQTSGPTAGFVTLVGGGFTWTDVSGAFSPVKNNGYFVTGTATGTLPASPSQGDTIKFFVDSASQFLTIQATGSQIIRLGSLSSSAGGTAVSTVQGDSVELVYRAADTCWCAVCGFSGTWMMT